MPTVVGESGGGSGGGGTGITNATRPQRTGAETARFLTRGLGGRRDPAAKAIQKKKKADDEHAKKAQQQREQLIELLRETSPGERINVIAGALG